MSHIQPYVYSSVHHMNMKMGDVPLCEGAGEEGAGR